MTLYTVHPDPPHPQGDGRRHARRARAPAPGRRPGSRRRLRLQAQRVRRGAAVHRAGAQARSAGALERDALRERRWPRSRAAARSSTSSSPPTPTASSRRCGSVSSPTWAPTCSSSPPASRCSAPSSTPVCTTSPRRTTSRAPAVFTNMTPTDAYRGAGRPEATYAIERAMDALAAEIGVDPLELRRRNFIRNASSSRTKRSPGSPTTRATTTRRPRSPPT